MREDGKRPWGRPGLTAGLVAALAMLAIMSLIRLVLDIPSLPELLSEAFTLALPLSLLAALLGALENKAKPLLLLTLVFGHLLMGALVGYLFTRLWAPSSPRPFKRTSLGNPWVGGLLVSAGLWLLALLVVMPASGVGFLGLQSRVGPWAMALSALASSLAYGLSLVALVQGVSRFPTAAPEEMSRVARERRALLLKVAAVPIAILAAGGIWQLFSGQGREPLEQVSGEPKKSPPGRLPQEITPNALFYTVSKNFRDPVVDGRQWSLDLRGPGGRGLTLSYNDLKSFPAVEQAATLICISNEVGGDLISNARWTGVRLRDLLARIGGSGAVDVVLKAWDDYADSIPFDRAIQEGTILAYLMNGEPLPPAHGFPARLVVPGIYGMKNVKWLTAIELVNYDFQVYWQERDWSDAAAIKSMSRLDVPRKGSTLPLAAVDLGGIAFTGDRGVSQVEVSGDGGKTWTGMRVKDALSPYAWSLWTGQWQPPGSGNYMLQVRARDGQGRLQEEESQPPLPDGASGYDTLSLRVR